MKRTESVYNMGQKQHTTKHSMNLDDAPTSKRSRTQHNGPFRYEKMIPGRDESQVASMQQDPGQLVFCRENLYRQNAVFRMGQAVLHTHVG
jgi:hypothetical protein